MLSLLDKERRRPLPPLAEMEIEADDRGADAESLHQDVGNEGFRAQAGKRRIEPQQEDAVETGRGKQPRWMAALTAKGKKPEDFLIK